MQIKFNINKIEINNKYYFLIRIKRGTKSWLRTQKEEIKQKKWEGNL